MDKKNYSAKAISQSDRTIRFVVSDETIDRDGDILIASGCDFSEFQGNPQFLGFHSYHEFPLGVPKSWGIDIRKRQVWMNVYFPTVDELSTDPATASEKAKLVDFTYNAYKTGLLNAVSVGFMTKDYEPTETGRKITKWNLLEVSAVPIPANPNAIAEARGMKSFAPEMLDILEGKKMDKKGGAKFSADTKKNHGAIVERMCKAYDTYNAEMKACHKALQDFMADEPEEETEKPNPNPGDDGKALDLDIVRKTLGISQESK